MVKEISIQLMDAFYELVVKSKDLHVIIGVI